MAVHQFVQVARDVPQIVEVVHLAQDVRVVLLIVMVDSVKKIKEAT